MKCINKLKIIYWTIQIKINNKRILKYQKKLNKYQEKLSELLYQSVASELIDKI